ncbi:hypothetical protein BD770DRAFT_154174 [Pilaira anomala]|nr:hypothetical protein BD770DRAFT_154174 [Pilaira anomala]
MDLKIGYNIQIEKILLNRIVGTKKDFRDLVYQSGLLQKNDDLKKLRISTQDKGLLSLFQKEWQLNIPIKSYFVLAQLHIDYVQLTLNQVVTDLDLKEGREQESIVVQDKTIPIENLYDSLCTHMWNNILNNTGIIHLCDVHCEYNDFMLFELFSRKTRIDFMGYFKQYISNKIFSVDTHFHFDDTQWVPLSSNCKCGIYLSVRDIIDISFQPVFQEIALLVATSLINNNLFGHYTNIEFIFNVICFNNNPKFHTILSDMLNEGQDSEVRSLFLPKLSNQLLQSIAHQRSSAVYKSFQDGELQQISNENYGFYFYCLKGYQSENISPFYKDEKNDEKSQDSEDVIFLLLEKGTIISRCGVKRLIYLKITENIKDKFLKIFISN